MDGSEGWDDYAAFYDWENARTLGRRDVPFWRRVVVREGAPALELGCGTGRLLIPMARTGISLTGIDRSEPMLRRARLRARRVPSVDRPAIVRGDIRALPFHDASFGVVVAPYGMLQSLVRDRDIDATLRDCARVLRPGGLLGVDLVPDLARWDEYRRTVRFRGRAGPGRTVTLVESVRQNPARGLTVFDEEFVERRGRETRRTKFSLTFRTRSMKATISRLERAGFRVETLLGDYGGKAWDRRAEVWVILARKIGT